MGAHVNRTAKAFTVALASRLPAGLTTTQVAVLSYLVEHPASSQRDIATATGIDTATLAEMLRRLEARGMVVRETDPTDARRTLVTVGEIEPETLDTAVRAAHEVNELALAGFDDAERSALIPMLARLRANLESP